MPATMASALRRPVEPQLAGRERLLPVSGYSGPAATSGARFVRALLARAARSVESVGTVAVLFIISGALFPLLRAGIGAEGLSPPTPIERVSMWGAYLFILAQASLRPRAILRAALRNPIVPGIALVAFLSVGWTDDTATSLPEAGLLAIWTLFALYLVARYRTEELLLHLGAALGVIAVLSLLFGLMVPEYGISQTDNAGTWRGVFLQKNNLGQTMLLACIVFFLLTRIRHGWQRGAAWCFLLLAIALILLSHSKTALVILCGLAVLMPAVLALRRGGRAAIAALCVLLMGATVAAIGFTEREPVLTALGKDLTLTGRTQLWSTVAGHIAERPLLGHGYKAFWERGGASEAVRAAVGWDAPHSHNALLDLWLDLGLAGLLVFIAGFLVAVRRAWAALRAYPALDGLWAMTILILMVPQNMVASPLYENRLAWVLFVVVALGITSHLSSRPAMAEVQPLRVGGYRHPLMERRPSGDQGA